MKILIIKTIPMASNNYQDGTNHRSIDEFKYSATVVLHNVLYVVERLVKYELQYIAQECE